MLRVAINGFGRIGRTTFKIAWEREGLDFVAINDLTDPSMLAYLLKYDSVFGTWDHEVEAGDGALIVDGKEIPVSAQKDPSALPWGELDVDVVIESTGIFTNREGSQQHIEAGAKKVVISAPADNTDAYLMGVNHESCPADEQIVNNASCTTNSIAPVAQVVKDELGVKKALMTTIHSVTASQNLVDGLPEGSDWRRGRSAMENMIPTTTGAAKATTKVIPELEGKFDGVAVRVPTIDVSLSDFTFVLETEVSTEELNEVFKKASENERWKGVLGVTDEPLVSRDFIQTPYSSVVDLSMSRVVDGDLAKVMAWYDNEWSYSERLVDMVEHVGNLKEGS
jgi:glyceraldehyde 3-phosphate dehydrogenase